MTNPTNWPNPERPGVPMFPNISGRHVLENKRRRSLKLVLWDHEEEHYCTEVGYMTPGNMVAMDWEYYAPCLTATQIAELLAGERERCAVTCEDNSVIMASDNKSIEIAINEILRITAEEIRKLGAVS
ncbi:MAG: hypothetical protein ABF976_10450 [Acetobacter syzygii]|uniref:hypothetical protein n=1 Tax=Acetobacter syzygii TaxID=146476 RepID=UPI0039EB1672